MIAVLLAALALAPPLPRELRVALTASAGAVAVDGRVTLSAAGAEPFAADRPELSAAGDRVRCGDRRLAPPVLVRGAPDLPPLQLRSLPGRASRARRYRGALLLFASAGCLTVVNHVALEDYLRGVVPAEMDPAAGAAALRAQAIAARSFALARCDGRRGASYDCTVSETQAYGGADAETAATDVAVAATAGQVLRVGKQVVEAVYSQCCGGVTNDPNEAWAAPMPGCTSRYDRPSEGVPELLEAELRTFLSAADGSWCRSDPSFRWELTLDRAELARRLGGLAAHARRGAGTGEVRGIEVAARGRAGRVTSLRLRGSEGDLTVVGDRVRWLFGEGDGALKSAFFAVEPAGDGVKLHGAGWGHGVGMCQAGAAAMAAAAKSTEEILAHYYAGARVEPVTP
ncbi:MAG: SpoIID/LytB domain-containing protein [Armatimonadetes bacterium]|nr:SpoIID/LytB domain-containing protein [Armatimonadota bacterium]